MAFRDDIQLAVKRFKSSTEASGRRRAREALREGKINGKLLDGFLMQSTIFPPNWNEMLDAYLFEVELRHPIPVPEKYDAVVDYPGSSSNFIAWSLDFDVTDVISVFTKEGAISSHLSAFILGKRYYEIDDADIRRQKMRNFILRQYPNVKDMTGRIKLRR